MTIRRGTGWRRMARLRRMTLSQRIQLVLGATLVYSIVTPVVVIATLRVEAALVEREDRLVRASLIAQRFESDVLLLSIEFEQFGRTGARSGLGDVDDLRASIRADREALRELTESRTVIAALDAYESLLPRRIGTSDSLMSATSEAQLNALLARRAALDSSAQALVQRMVTGEVEALDALRRERAAFRGRALRGMIVVGALNVAIVVWLLVSLVRGGITRRLRQLTDMARQVAAGDFSKRTFIEGDDEISVLAESLNDMAGQLATFDKVKEEFVALASHQLRTPATAVKGSLGMLIEGYAGDMTPEQLEYLTDAYQSNERQFGIINDILWVARIDAGRLILSPAALDLATVAADVVRELRPVAATRGQVVRDRIEGPVLMQGDAQKLRMVVENLAGNASKYTPEGGHVEVALHRAGGVATLTISDTGVGIAREDMGRLFVKFSRVPNPLSDVVGGSGLGLYLAREIVLLHGGTIEVESEPGAGTTFTVTLPAE